jgi:hypothetical protein
MWHRFRFVLLGVLAVIVIGVSVWWFASPAPVRPVPVERAPAREEHASRIPTKGTTPRTLSHAAGAPDATPLATVPASTADENSPEADPLRANWQAVDLEDVRRALPDNIYWKLSAPTKDPQLQEWRDAERARWNVEYGKILSGTASEQEIRAYYDQRARMSGDYVEFATYILDHYGDTLPERDTGLLKLARRLNLARLEEIPRKVEEALQRKQAQDAARAAWLADQAQFGGGDADPSGPGAAP